jgi:signal transduction histidine kinase
MEPWLENFARANFQRSADTAHDLKTPLNVAVLNLELLRMRLRKVAGDDDPKIAAYTAAIECELRRMGSIFDAFFLLSTPPKDSELTTVDIAAICEEVASRISLDLGPRPPSSIEAHEPRIRQAFELFFEGAAKIIVAEQRDIEVSTSGDCYSVTIEGTPREGDFELTKIFKFYYTDPDGNPDLSLAVARLIAETYGGELYAARDRDKVTLRLSFPLGAR